MPRKIITPTRRNFLKTSTAAAGVGLFAPGIIRSARASGYPTRGFNITIPTNTGGGVELNTRAFMSVWTKYLNDVPFELEFFPGAGGQIGYETYVHAREQDGYNIMFGNIGPEVIMYATQDTNYRIPEDVRHIAAIAGVPMVIFVSRESPFQTIGDLVEEGMSRTVNISTSRLPHPATIGALAIGDETGADFNLVPYAGGSPTSMAALSMEVDAAATTANQAVGLIDEIRVLCVFKHDPLINPQMNNPPTANEALGLNLPDLEHNTGIAIHGSVWRDNEEVRTKLSETLPLVFEDPELEEAYNRHGLPYEAVSYTDADNVGAIVEKTIELTNRYRDLLAG